MDWTQISISRPDIASEQETSDFGTGLNCLFGSEITSPDRRSTEIICDKPGKKSALMSLNACGIYREPIWGREESLEITTKVHSQVTSWEE